MEYEQPYHLPEMYVIGNTANVTGRRLIKDYTGRTEEKMFFLNISDGDLISLPYGGTYEGISLPCGVFRCIRKKDKYHLTMLPLAQRNRAIERFRAEATDLLSPNRHWKSIRYALLNELPYWRQ